MSEVVADGRFELAGTPAQNAILRPLWTPGSPSFINFPWDLMDDLPRYPVPIGWDDLNDGSLRVAAYAEPTLLRPVNPRFHEPGSGIGHSISRPGVDGRLQIAGVFWSDGRIKIDIRMEARPDAAREVCSAELAHAVDYGLPLTDQMKQQIMELLHPGGADEHTWWEKRSYGSEYFTLAGETFMALFTHAYSKMTPWQDPFTHKSTPLIAAKLPGILGALPVGGQVKYLSGYRTFHRSGPGTHYEARWAPLAARVVRLPRSEAVASSLVACRVCKP